MAPCGRIIVVVVLADGAHVARRPFDYLVREGVPNLMHNVRDVGVAVVASNTCTFQPKDNPIHHHDRVGQDAECPKWMTHVKEDTGNEPPKAELGKRKTKEINYKGQSDLEFNRLLKNGGEEPGQAGTSGGKRSKKGKNSGSQKVPKQLKANMMKVWNRVNICKDPVDGRMRNVLFEDLPDRKQCVSCDCITTAITAS